MSPPPSSLELRDAKWPLGHERHDKAPDSDATWPDPQDVQTDDEVAPETDEDLPGKHLWQTQLTKHSDAPVAEVQSPYSPATQGDVQRAPATLAPENPPAKPRLIAEKDPEAK